MSGRSKRSDGFSRQSTPMKKSNGMSLKKGVANTYMDEGEEHAEIMIKWETAQGSLE